jgi:cyclic dehypoxanthinyl futalosine synthase
MGNSRACLRGVTLHQLGAVAHAVRREMDPGDEVTSIVDRNINYTNVCIYRCRFCVFCHKPEEQGAYVLPFEMIAKKVDETVAAGGTGILLQGGDHPALRIDFYEGLLRQLKTAFPAVHLHAFSASEIWYIAKGERLPLSHVIARLRAAGLESIPGGGAEVLEDETRRRIWSHAKVSAVQRLGVHREAHRQRMRTTATMMCGVGEDHTARIEHLLPVIAGRHGRVHGVHFMDVPGREHGAGGRGAGLGRLRLPQDAGDRPIRLRQRAARSRVLGDAKAQDRATVTLFRCR